MNGNDEVSAAAIAAYDPTGSEWDRTVKAEEAAVLATSPALQAIVAKKPIVNTTMGINVVPARTDAEINDIVNALVPGGVVDNSRGVSAIPVGAGRPSTARLATARTLTNRGATDYKQFQYGNINWRGADTGTQFEPGVATTPNFGAGAFGATQVAGARFRDGTGLEGNPYFLATQYTPAGYTTVEPFKVRLRSRNIQVNSATTDPDKLLFDVSTLIDGEPIDSFVGYKRTNGESTRENYFSALSKGVMNLPVDALGLFYKTGLSIGALPSWAMFGSDTTMKALREQNISFDRNVSNAWRNYMGTGESENQTFWTRMGAGTPSAIFSLGLLKLGAAAAGLGGIAAATTALNAGSSVDIAIRAQENGVSPMGSLISGYAGGGVIAAVDMLGLNRTWRMQKAGLANTLLEFGVESAWRGPIRESVTEGFQTAVELAANRDLFMRSFLDNFSDIAADAVVGGISALVTLPADIRQQRLQESALSIVKGELKENASDFEKALDKAVTALAETGYFTREQALNGLVGAASEEGQNRFIKFFQDAYRGELDKLTPEQVAAVEALPEQLQQMAATSFKALDDAVLAQLPESLPETTKTMITRAMRGIASVIGVLAGRDIQLPTIKVVEGGGSQYIPETNTIQIDTSNNGIPLDANLVTAKSLSPISPMQRKFLHELGHYLDYQLGVKGKGFKEFLPAYYEAISKIYGPKAVEAVKKEDPEGTKRLDGSTKKSEYISAKNPTELFAHALGRLGRDVGEAIGLVGNVADYIDIANIMGKHLLVPDIQEALSMAFAELDAFIKSNDEYLEALAKGAGEKGLASRIDDFANGDKNALSPEDVNKLIEILSSEVGSRGSAILASAFSNTSPETFMQKTNREFKEAVDKEARDTNSKVDIRGERKTLKEYKASNKKNAEMVPDGKTLLANLLASDNLEQDKPANGGAPAKEITIPMLEADGSVAGDNKKSNSKSKSGIQKRTTAKVNGRDFDEDVSFAHKILEGAKKAPKWFQKIFNGYTTGDLTTFMWTLGGKEMVNAYDFPKLFNDADVIAKKSMEDFYNKLQKSLFKNRMELDSFENMASMKTIEARNVRNEYSGVPETRMISPLQAMVVYLHMKNPKTQGKVLYSFSGDEAAVQDVISALTDEQKKYADIMQEVIKENWSRYKRSFTEQGEEIDDDPYFPITEATAAAIGHRIPNSQKTRDLSKTYGISLEVDARELFNNYIRRAAGGEVGLYSTIQRVKDMFGFDPNTIVENLDYEGQVLADEIFEKSKMLRGMAIDRLGGIKNVNNFLNLLDDFVNNSERRPVGSSYFDMASRTITTGLLSWKLKQGIKNLTNFASFWGLAEDQNAYWRNTAWAAAHPREALKYMLEHVPYIKNRWKGGNIDEQLTQASAGSDSIWLQLEKSNAGSGSGYKQFVSNTTALVQMLKRAGVQPMLIGDLMANIIGGYGLMKEYETKFGSVEAAADELSKRIIERQSSSNQATRSLMQRTWNRDARGQLIAFTSEGLQKWKSMARAIAEVARGERTVKSAAMEIASTLSAMAAFVLVAAGIWDLFDDDDKNDEEVFDSLIRETIGQLTGAHIFGNSIIAPILSMPFTDRDFSIGTPFTSQVTKELNRLTKGEWAQALVDGGAVFAGLAGTDAVSNVLGGAYETALGDTSNEREAGFRRLFGESKGSAERRSGVKK